MNVPVLSPALRSRSTRRGAVFALATAACLIVAQPCRGDATDGVAKRARDKKGKVVMCSPPKSPEDAQSFKRPFENCPNGGVLRLAPGNYDPQDIVEIVADNVVVEGDGSGGFCAAKLVLHGDNCVVRSINLHAVEGRNLTIIDSKIDAVVLWGATKGNVKSYAINCLLQRIALFPNNADFCLAQTTILSPTASKTFAYGARAGYGGYDGGTGRHVSYCVSFGRMESKGKVEISNCVIYSNGDAFLPPPANGDLLGLKLSDNIIYARDNLLTAKDVKVRDPRELDKFFDLRKGNLKSNKSEAPDFANPLPKAADDWRDCWNFPGKFFVLKDKSGTYGARVNDNGLPID